MKARTFSFDCQTAMAYGVDEAIMIHNLIFWIEKNQANGKHFHDGRTWTYNTQKSFSKIFPFWNERQVGRILKSLISQDVIVTANYNQTPYDQTKWYAFKNEIDWLNDLTDRKNSELTKTSNGNDENVKSNFNLVKLESHKSVNRIENDVEPIPDTNQIKKQIDNNNNELLLLNFEETALLPLSGLNERQVKEASKKLTQLSPDQREIAIHSFNQTAERGRIKRPMALIHELVNLGLENKLEPPLSAFNQNPTPTPTQELKTHSEANNEDSRKETLLEILKIKVAKHKPSMLAEFQRIRAVHIPSLGVIYEDDLAAAGLFD